MLYPVKLTIIISIFSCVCPEIYPSFYQSSCLIYLSIYPRIYPYIPVSIPMCLSVYPCIELESRWYGQLHHPCKMCALNGPCALLKVGTSPRLGLQTVNTSLTKDQKEKKERRERNWDVLYRINISLKSKYGCCAWIFGGFHPTTLPLMPPNLHGRIRIYLQPFLHMIPRIFLCHISVTFRSVEWRYLVTFLLQFRRDICVFMHIFSSPSFFFVASLCQNVLGEFSIWPEAWKMEKYWKDRFLKWWCSSTWVTNNRDRY